MEQLSFRIKPGKFLKEEIEKIARGKKVEAGVLLSAVGGLENAVLRMPGSTPENQTIKSWSGPFEIVSAMGTISPDGCHIHVALSDKEGNVIGGHLKERCVIKFTAEIVIGVFDDITYKRVLDKETGFRELKVKTNS